ncbi:MAG: 50S ribosomal protein L33 [Methylotenera sp.]|nr:50S ribosomal protein L33 [Oligoflexia bacterium]
MRVQVSLECTECKRKNYSTDKNKQKTTDKLEFKKFCRACRKHSVHREAK